MDHLILMIKHYRSQIPLANLLVCLCMASLAALPMGNIIGISGLEMVGIELEYDNPFEHSEEIDEEFVIIIDRTLSADLRSSKSQSTTLGYHNPLLAPASPPPKHA